MTFLQLVDKAVDGVHRRLSVVVKRKDDIPRYVGIPGKQGGVLPKIAGQLKSLQMSRIIMAQPFDHGINPIWRMVAHHDHFVINPRAF